MTTEKISIKNKQVLHVEAITPVLISVGHFTDIPVFYV